MLIGSIGCSHGIYPPTESWPSLDVFIHAGDIVSDPTMAVAPTPELRIDYQLDELKTKFLPWLHQIRAKHKIVIPGNHDIWGHDLKNLDLLRIGNCYCLYNEAVVCDGITIWGTPYSVQVTSDPRPFRPFRARHDQLAAIYRSIPENADIIISHSPPFNILDFDKHGDSGMDYQNWGSRTFTEYLKTVKDKIVICSHVHSQGGNQMTFNENQVYNVAIKSKHNLNKLTLIGYNPDLPSESLRA